MIKHCSIYSVGKNFELEVDQDGAVDDNVLLCFL